MATTFIAGSGVQSTPYTIPNTDNNPVTPLSVSAEFVNASGTDCLGCLSFYTSDGRLLGRFRTDDVITAGDTAQVTWRPFSGGAGSSTAGGGIQFAKDPQTGTYLHVSTTSFDPSDPNGAGVGFYTTGGNPFVVGTASGAEIDLLQDGGATSLLMKSDELLAFTDRTTFDMLDGVAAGLQSILLDLGSTNGLLQLSANLGAKLRFKALTSLAIQKGSSNFVTVADDGSGHNASEFLDVSGFVIDLRTSGTVTIKDHTGATVFQVTEAGHVSMPNLPTSAAGLSSGELWNNANVVNIV